MTPNCFWVFLGVSGVSFYSLILAQKKGTLQCKKNIVFIHDKGKLAMQDLNKRALAAVNNPLEFECLLTLFKPFLWNRVSKLAGSSSDDRDEMMSAAMQAFYEAVVNFDQDKGHFFPFLDRVVQVRLIDSLRKLRAKKNIAIPLDADKEETAAEPRPIIEASLKTYQATLSRQDLVLEIDSFKLELSAWDLSMDLLVKHSPKHTKVQELYKRIVREVAENDEVIQTIQEKHYFPIKKVAELTKLPRKTIERARIFIIASIIIIQGDYDYLRHYVAESQSDYAGYTLGKGGE